MEGLNIVAVKPKRAPRNNRRKQSAKSAGPAEPEDGMLRGSDMGSPLQLARGVTEYSTDTLIPLDPDDKSSLLRAGARAQKVWAPDRLVKGRNPVLTNSQYMAAMKFYDDFCIGELGARPNQTRLPVRLDPWNRMPFSEQRYARRVSWERAVMAVGGQYIDILVWCVLQMPSLDRADIPPTVATWAEHRGWGVERAVGWLAGALESLAVHYGFVRGGSVEAVRACVKSDGG